MRMPFSLRGNDGLSCARTIHRKGGPDMAEIDSPGGGGGPLSAGDQIFRDRPITKTLKHYVARSRGAGASIQCMLEAVYSTAKALKRTSLGSNAS